MLKELFGSGGIGQLKELESWMKEREAAKKKEEDEKKKKERPKPPTFSVLQVFLILTGLGPFVGLLVSRLQIELVQNVLDAIRTVH